MRDTANCTPPRKQLKAEDRNMVKSIVQRVDGEAWFAEEKHSHELYQAKVGTGTIVVAIGNLAKVPIKNTDQRREHISKVVAYNVERFFLSKFAVETICRAFKSQNSEMETRKCAEWIESQRGRDPREVMIEARRRFAGVAEELLFGQFEKAVGRQVRLSIQEWEALRRLADGMLQKQIGDDMKSVAKNNYLRKRNGLGNSLSSAANPSTGDEPDQGLREDTVRKVVKALRQKSGHGVNTLKAVLWFLGLDS